MTTLTVFSLTPRGWHAIIGPGLRSNLLACLSLADVATFCRAWRPRFIEGACGPDVMRYYPDAEVD